MFKFNGITSKDMSVIVEEDINLLGKSSQRVQVIDIEGKNGSELIPLGYSNFSNTLTLTLMKDNLDDVIDWLDGTGILEFKGRIAKVSFYGSINPVRLASKIRISIDFTREPFWYKKNDEYKVVENEVINEGNMSVFPFIMLTKQSTNEFEVSINDVRFKYVFNETKYVVIDCLEKNAKEDETLRNRFLNIDFIFPSIHPGSNKIKIHSGDAVIQIKRKDCWK